VYVAYPDLRNAVIAHKTRVPAAADETTVECLSSVLSKLDVLRIGDGPIPHCLTALEILMTSSGGALALDNASEALPESTSHNGSDLKVRSALPLIPLRPGRDASYREADHGEDVKGVGYGPALHDFAFRIELCATEICAAMMAHHPEAPWGLRFDLAKQTRDESRHFELFASRVRQLGVRLGDMPLQFEVWDKFVVGENLPERANHRTTDW
jgi:hypothetical protein